MDGFHVGDMRFGHGVDALSNFPSTGMASNSVSSGMAISQYASSGWDPLLCPSQDRHFTNPPFIPVFPMSTTHQIIKEDEGSRCNFPSLFGHNPPVAFIEQVPEISCSDGRRFPEMLGYFGLPETPITTNFGSADMEGDVNEGTSVNNGPSQDCQISEEDVVRSSRSGSRRKRARVSNSPYVCMDDQVDLKRNPSVSTFDVPKEHEEKKQKIGQTPCSNSHDKQNGKQTEENASSAEASKENYIHVRARRGQATNSHSLAERVRREKISERMRMLQELVPGCNKITGKAVMLDEIINYVQSLQQQVEFLSMKLATVSPELDIDLERILSKEILLSQGNSATMHGIGHGMVSSHPHTQGNFQEAFPGLPSSHQQYPPLTQAFPEIELQTAFQGT